MSARNGLNDFHQIGNHVQNKIIHLTSNLCEAVDIHVEDIFFESKKIVFYSKLFRLRAYFIPLPTLEVDSFFYSAFQYQVSGKLFFITASFGEVNKLSRKDETRKAGWEDTFAVIARGKMLSGLIWNEFEVFVWLPSGKQGGFYK